jgi:predicted heme/steroid binding protein
LTVALNSKGGKLKFFKLDRFFAWVLFISMLLFFISGYGMTRGIITNSLAIDIHNKILPPVTIAAFTIHTWYAIHLAFKRWQIWNWFTKIFLVLFFVAFIGYFNYLQYFYQEKTNSDTGNTISDDNSNNSANTDLNNSADNIQTKTFTVSELSKYNGKNGQPSYIAVNSKVYDVSDLFINGTHRGCNAGQDVTANFSDVHSQSILSQFSIVGTLVN